MVEFKLFGFSIRLRSAVVLIAGGFTCWLGITGSALASITGVDPEFAALIARCAPTVNPETMAAVVSAESRGHQFAIADAGPVGMPWAQRKHLVRSYYMGSADAATAKAMALIAAGHTVSLGFAQVNDRNLARMGLSVRAMFEPCTNLAAGGKILTEFYTRAVKKFGPGSQALRAALSAYNSGDWVRGEKDGYVGLIYKQIGRPLAMKTAAVVPPVQAQRVNSGLSPQKADGGRVFTISSAEFTTAQ
ncbi:lytic transglycosylase domain-containing protein [Janthinobacterium sp. CAN_S7]|uniref:lytic transglycosylase domain-containing protein n=1 Tax=Janthinobacterium sp. CAN_S7 TaxID=3071704 RepID=UPI00319EB5C9